MSKYNMLSGKVDSILKNGDKIDELTSKQDELKAICSDGISSIKNDLKATCKLIISESGSDTQNNEKILKLVDSIDKKLDKGLSLLESIEDTYEDTNIDVSCTKEALNTICEVVTRISKTLNVDFSIPMDELLFGAKEETQPDDSTLQKNQEEAPEVPRRRMNTKYDPSSKYLNSVQLRDKYRGREMELFGREIINPCDINSKMVELGFAQAFKKGNGLKATELGLKSGVVANVDSHLQYTNSDDTDKLLSKFFKNRLKTKAFIDDLKGNK